MSRSIQMSVARTWVLTVILLVAGCGGSEESSPISPSSATVVTGFTLQGDPESTQGASWTYRAEQQGTTYDLQGILFKPSGAGPFGAVVVSHGAGGNVNAYSRGVATEMRRWGLVAIATNYTHAGGVPIGAPGTLNEPGASQANVLRAHAVREILRTLTYVDQGRVAAHGHSMGAFVTTAVIAAYPNDFRVASHTAGGVRQTGVDAPAPTEAQARLIRTPYQLHHGDDDTVVLLALDQRLDGILTSNAVPHELHIYPGGTHNEVAQHPMVLSRIRSWYAAHQVAAGPQRPT